MSYAVLLWDFGDTLVDERWMRRAPAGVPGWADVWDATMADLADAWNVGATSSAAVYAALAERTGMGPDEVAAHAAHCCRQITFHEEAWRVAGRAAPAPGDRHGEPRSVHRSRRPCV